MATEQPTPKAPPPRGLDPLAGFLSYLMPGLGQISQGRAAKGVLFLVSLYALFFYGMALGDWNNVYLPDTGDRTQGGLARLAGDLYARPHFAGQFWIGVAAWPAVYQYWNYDDTKDRGPVFGRFQRAPRLAVVNSLQRDADKRWDLGWVYTVIAGVLNLLVIYDATAGPAYRPATGKPEARPKEAVPS